MECTIDENDESVKSVTEANHYTTKAEDRISLENKFIYSIILAIYVLKNTTTYVNLTIVTMRVDVLAIPTTIILKIIVSDNHCGWAISI